MSAMADYAIWLEEHGLADSEASRNVYKAIAVMGSPMPQGKTRATCTRCGEQFLASDLTVARLLLSAHTCGQEAS